MPRPLADLVRMWRERALLSQEQLANRTGLGVRTIRRLEADSGHRPRGTSIHLLADALGLSDTEREELTTATRGTQASIGSPHQPRPAQLPADLAWFTGRSAELDELLSLDREPRAVVITAIDGMAGIGKTALAICTAHRLAGRYPDGQLFLDLHGYTQGIGPVAPEVALDRMLRALGVSGPQIPVDLDERAALYRSRLADQRMLIVLDNAATETQLRPLLPGAPGCLVLITSRRRLAGLDHTRTVSLDALPSADAVALFTRTAGEGRLATEPPELVTETVELCGRLPLAIRIAAARLRSHPSWSLSHLVERLRDQQHRLAALEAGQRSVTRALDLSYQDLSLDQQRTYRLLGLHQGPDFETYATAALLDSTAAEATRLLDQLLDAHLLQEPAPGRYVFHDLTRAHAAHTALAVDAEPDRRAALTRLFDHYRHAAASAMDTIHPYEHEHRPRVPPAGTPIPDLSDPARATTWLDTELPNLLGGAQHAAAHGWDEHTWHLSAILHLHLRTRGRYSDAETLHNQALTTARNTGNRTGELEALTGLGHIHRLQDRYGPAADHYGLALELARTTNNHTGELDALAGLGHIHRHQGRHTHADDHYRQALQIARTTGNHTGELNALTGLARIKRLQGRHEQALDHLGQALRIARAAGNRVYELDALYVLGHTHRQQGRHEQAFDYYRQALQIARTTGNRTGELNALTGLGHTHRQLGQYGLAADRYQQALQIARTTGNHGGELNALTGLGHVHRLRGNFAPALAHYELVLYFAQKMSDRNWQFEACQGLGRLSHATGHIDAAIAHHRQALTLADQQNQPTDQARAHDGLAHAHHALHQPTQARQHWQHALKLLTDLGIDCTDDEATTSDIRIHLADLI